MSTRQRSVAAVCQMWWVLVCCMVMACGGESRSPSILRVEPAEVFNGDPIDIEIVGQHFYPTVIANVYAPDQSELNTDFLVRLIPGALDPDAGTDDTDVMMETLLGPVRFLSTSRIAVPLPAGLPTGVYDLEVTTPAGLLGTATDVLRVVDGRAAALEISTNKLSYRVFEQATASVRLLDRVGEVVPQPLSVKLSVEVEDGADVAVAFEPLALRDQMVDGQTVTGFLDADGTADVVFSVASPATLTVRIDPMDESGRVSGDDARVQWLPGNEIGVQVERLTDEPVIAGEPFPVRLTFVDEWGNVLPDVEDTVIVGDACSSWATLVLFQGSVQIDAQTRDVTGTELCAEGRIVVNDGLLGRSDPFDVAPGPVARFEVENFPRLLTAGEEFTALVEPVDAYGNAAEWPFELDFPTDSVDGVVGSRCEGSGGIQTCFVNVIRVGAGIEATFRGPPDLVGTSRPYQVLPAAPAVLRLDVPSPVWTAGDAADVDVWLEDAFGNAVDSSELDTGAVVWEASEGAVSCGFLEVTDAGRSRFRCTATVSGQGISLTATLSGLTHPASTTTIEVRNGRLAELFAVLAEDTVVAGAVTSLLVEARDAFGNIYLHQDVQALTITDTTGTVAPTSAILNAEGRANVGVRFLRSGTATVTVTADENVLGISNSVLVEPAEAERMELEFLEPWAWVGSETDVFIQVVDAFGNRVPVDVTASLRSSGSAGATVNVPVVNGTAVGRFEWHQASISDTVIATSAGLSSGSASILVARDCGTAGPVAELTFPAPGGGRYCAHPVLGTAEVSVSLGASTATSGAVVAFGVSVSGQGGGAGTASNRSVQVDRVGTHDLLALAVQNDGCGSTVTSKVYVGEVGVPTGVVSMVAADASLSLGGSTEATQISVLGVEDCAGDVVSRGALRVRTDLGDITGASATGTGLSVALDGAGNTNFILDVADVDTGGTAAVQVWADEGAAQGQLSVEVLGDERSPEVWSQSPKGAIVDPLDEIVVVFSEAMDPASLTPDTVWVTGSTAVAVTDAVLDPLGHELTVQLDQVVAASSGASWQLVISDEAMDLAGNPLDGDWSGSAMAYQGAFGVEVAVPAVDACDVSPEIFRPDGDDGIGQEADDTTLSFQAPVAPAWWVVDVVDADGVVIRNDFVVPVGAMDAWDWDGRDESGRLAEPGNYTVAVRAEGNQGNRGAACARPVVIGVGAP